MTLAPRSCFIKVVKSEKQTGNLRLFQWPIPSRSNQLKSISWTWVSRVKYVKIRPMFQIAKKVVVWGTTRDGTIQTECICWYQILQLPGCLRYHTNTQLGSPWKTTRYKNLTGGSWRSGTNGTKCPKRQAIWWQIQPPNRLPLKGLLELSNVMPIISVIVAMTVQPTSHNMTKPWPTIFCIVRESVTMQIMTLKTGRCGVLL